VAYQGYEQPAIETINDVQLTAGVVTVEMKEQVKITEAMHHLHVTEQIGKDDSPIADPRDPPLS
jgi:hypothetical protein